MAQTNRDSLLVFGEGESNITNWWEFVCPSGTDGDHYIGSIRRYVETELGKVVTNVGTPCTTP